jgi:hypothetical protein
MGQLLSRQDTPVKKQQERNRGVLQNQSRRHRRSFEARVGSNRLDSSETHLNDWTSSRKRYRSGAQENEAYSQPLKEVYANVGAPKRQQKYARARALSDYNKVKDSDHQRTRKRDIPQPNGRRRDTNPRETRVSESKSVLQHLKSQTAKECIICTDTRSLGRFPDRRPTEECTHGVSVCRRCLRKWIQSEFSTKTWNEINCPVCTARMQYHDIQAFAPHQVFHR